MELKARTSTTEHTEESSAWSSEEGQGLGSGGNFHIRKSN